MSQPTESAMTRAREWFDANQRTMTPVDVLALIDAIRAEERALCMGDCCFFCKYGDTPTMRTGKLMHHVSDGVVIGKTRWQACGADAIRRSLRSRSLPADK